MRARRRHAAALRWMDERLAGGRSWALAAARNERDCPVTISAKSPPGLAWKRQSGTTRRNRTDHHRPPSSIPVRLTF